MLEGELYLPGESALHKADPRLKMGGLIVLGGLMTFVDQGGLLILTLGSVLLWRLGCLSPRVFRLVVKAALLLGGFYTLVMGWSWDSGGRFWEGHWSVEGVVQGLMMGWRIALVFFLTRIFAAVTLPSEQGAGIAYFLTPFSCFTKKAADFALLITLTLRFIPLLLEEVGLLYKARLAKGSLPSGRMGRLKELSFLLLPLLRIALRRSEELAENLTARGWVSGGYRVLGTKKWERRDTWGAVLLVLWGIGILAADRWCL